MSRVNLNFTEKQTAIDRWNVCKSCEHFQSKFYSCYQCGCFMPTKVRKPLATCPENKWDHIPVTHIGDGLEFHYPLSDIDENLREMGDI